MKFEMTVSDLSHACMFLDNLTDDLPQNDDGKYEGLRLRTAFAWSFIRIVFTDTVVEAMNKITAADTAVIIDELRKARDEEDALGWNTACSDLWTACREVRDTIEPLV